MSEIFLTIVNMSICASWLVLAVLLLRLVLKKAPKWVNVLLWGFVAFRLVCPFSFESMLSLIPSAETVSPQIMMEPTPQISTGIHALNSTINPILSESFAPAVGDSVNPLQIWIPVVSAVWMTGIAVMLIYTAVSFFLLRRKVDTAVRLRNNIFQSENVDSPFVLGIIKPTIYLPFQMDGENLEYVIAHEEAHIRRKDHWWKPVGFVLLAVHWFNPLMWVGYILLCRDIELACDEKVIKELDNENRAEYTQALVACSINRRSIAACPLAFGEVGVKERVKSVMNYRKPGFWIILAAIVICIAVAVCFLTNPNTSMDEKLSVFIDCQIAGHFQTEKSEGNACCVNWEVLGTEKRGAETTVYMWVLYEEYSLQHFQLHSETACHIPTVITAKYEGGAYQLIEYWEPRDGNNYASDIREKFPWHVQQKALDPQRYYQSQHEENNKMALEYFDSLPKGPQFNAKVIEVHDQYLLVEPEEGSIERTCSDRIEVYWSTHIPRAGDWVTVVYDGQIQETYPARITNVLSVEMILDEDAAEIIYGNPNAYFKLKDGTWRFDGRIYKYRHAVTGRLPNSDRDTTFVYLSNLESITFDQAWKALLSSNCADWFLVEDAVLVEWNGYRDPYDEYDAPTAKLTLDDVIRLSKKGYELDWSDFEQYDHYVTGSGLYIRVYEIDGFFSLWIGGSYAHPQPTDVMYMLLLLENDHEQSIDIRDGGVEAFIAKHKTGTVTDADVTDGNLLPQPASRLDSMISSAILYRTKSEYPDGLINTESHIILGHEVVSATPALGQTVHLREEAVFVYYLNARFRVVDGSPEEYSSNFSQAIITFSVDEKGDYILKDFLDPKYATDHDVELLERFVSASENAAANAEEYEQQLRAGCIKTATDYLENLNAQSVVDTQVIYPAGYDFVIDNILYDIDDDGAMESCSLTPGPTSGLFSFSFYASSTDPTAPTVKYSGYCVSYSAYDLSFEIAEDGTLRIKGVDGSEPDKAVYFDYTINEDEILIWTEDE